MYRFTLSWVRPLLDLAKTKSQLSLDDVPILDHANTTSSLQSRFGSVSSSTSQGRSFLYRLYKDHRRTFIYQQILISIESVVAFLPQICLFQLLSLLEARKKHDVGNGGLWYWVAGLAISKMAHVISENW